MPTSVGPDGLPTGPISAPRPPPEPRERPGRRYPKAPFSLLEFLLQFRWLVIVPFVLPLSLLWARYHELKCWLSTRSTGKKALTGHENRVSRVVRSLKSRKPESDGLICSARPAFWSVSARSLEYKKSKRFAVDLNDFVNILNVDEDAMVLRVEPYVRMAQITQALLPRKLCVPVVPEYDDLTVGGLISGYGIEGSSHKYGLFADTVLAVDLVLADGTFVTATRENEYNDLFHAIQWSQGTIAMIVAAELRLKHVQDFVKLTYVPVTGDLQHIAKEWEKVVAPEDRPWPEFQEGIVYSSTKAVLMSGEYASREEAMQSGNINTMSWWFKPWFYKYAESFLSLEAGEMYTEFVPTRDYFHRHTRALYWECELLVPFGNHAAFRCLLGWLMPPRISFLKLTTVGKGMVEYYQERHNAQDVLVPMRHTGGCLEKSHDLFDIYPIWLNAHRVFRTSMNTMVACEPDYYAQGGGAGDTQDAQMWTDVGIWGVPRPITRGELFDAPAAESALEQFLISVRGYQALYAVTELSEADFWRMFDKRLYDAARVKYGAQSNFMDIYFKVHQRKSPGCEDNKAE